MDQTSRRSPAWPWVLGASVVAAVFLVANLLVANWTLQTGEVDQLVRGIKSSEQVMSTATDQMSKAIAAAGAQPTPAEQEKLLSELQTICAKQAAELRSTGQQLVTLRIAPWQRGPWNAREAYVAHQAAWQAFLDGGVFDPHSLFLDHPEITSTWDTVVAKLPLAVPLPDPYDLAGRINAIVVEGSQSDAEPGTPVIFHRGS